ncbi:TPA: hypothetical protein ACKQC7_004307 [Serratia marcescens]
MMTTAKRHYKPTAHRSVRVPIDLDEAIIKRSRQEQCSYAAVVLNAVRSMFGDAAAVTPRSAPAPAKEGETNATPAGSLAGNYPYLSKYQNKK